MSTKTITKAKGSRVARPVVAAHRGDVPLPAPRASLRPRRQYMSEEVGDAEDAALSNAVSYAAGSGVK